MSLCLGCMHEKQNNTICPRCGYDNSQSQGAPYLPANTLLKDRFLIGRRLETNGESTRYIGFDNTAQKIVTIREYLPIGHIIRDENEAVLKVLDGHEDIFSNVKANFISYYKTVERLKDFSAMMTVYTVFEANNTAYVVEEYAEMIPFEEYTERSGGSLDWDVARPLFMPVISALEALHKNNIGHYAVSPSNMFITSTGKIKLAGFSTEYERKRGTVLRSQLFSGCAAPEQYEKNYPLDSKTEIYGFTATLFYALTGNIPENAQERLKDSRLLMSKNTVKRLPPHVVSALANGLNVDRKKRIKDFDDLRSQLSAAATVQAIQEEISRTSSMTPVNEDEKNKQSGMSPTSVVLVSLIVSLIVFSILGYLWYLQNPLQGMFSTGENVQETTAPIQQEWTGPVVQDYTGKTYDEVSASAESDDKVVIVRAIKDEYSDTVPQGSIISQYPAPNTPIESEGESTVFVTVSKGPLMRALPNIENLTVSEAAKLLSDAGFLATAETEFSDKYGESRVIAYKSNQPGDKLEEGTTVVIRVSKGVESTQPTQQ